MSSIDKRRGSQPLAALALGKATNFKGEQENSSSGKIQQKRHKKKFFLRTQDKALEIIVGNKLLDAVK